MPLALSFSLPTQRCFCYRAIISSSLSLFSAYAEVFLGHFSPAFRSGSFLCLRRGVSRGLSILFLYECFSLPTQRCFPRGSSTPPPASLFSAYAEVFLEDHQDRSPELAFLCLRRGVSLKKPTVVSLRKLFSAYAEVFPWRSPLNPTRRSFLCLRRGVSR